MKSSYLLKITFLSFVILVSTPASRAQGLFGDYWREEVITSDGDKIIVDRSQKYGGPHELGQDKPVNYQKLSFYMPGASEKVTWEDEANVNGSIDLVLLSMDIYHATVYIIATPSGCESWKALGKPPLPYVIFRFGPDGWLQIPLSELPLAINKSKLTIDRPPISRYIENGLISAKNIEIINSAVRQEYLREIKRQLSENSCK